MRIDEVSDAEQGPEPDPDGEIRAKLQALRGLCRAFLDEPASDPGKTDAEDERAISGQIQAAVAIAEASLDLLAAHVFRLYGDPNEGD